MGLVIMQDVAEIAKEVHEENWFSGVSCFELPLIPSSITFVKGKIELLMVTTHY